MTTTNNTHRRNGYTFTEHLKASGHFGDAVLHVAVKRMLYKSEIEHVLFTRGSSVIFALIIRKITVALWDKMRCLKLLKFQML
jgi:hypothetical protein